MNKVFQRLQRLHPKIIDLKLNRVTVLLAKLGNPEKQLPPVIHVAGTNGKGSTIAMIKSSLQKNDCLVHVYTSPHLVNFCERIQIAGKEISQTYLEELLLECEEKNEDLPITFFEIVTCAAFLAFSRSRADFTILEVGLGGKYDATNVIKKPTLSIITPISIDHKEYLGSSIKKIAKTKAGIIKKNSPTVIGEQDSMVENILLEKCLKVGSIPIKANHNFSISKKEKKIFLQDINAHLSFPFPNLIGVHQIVNSMTAIKALLNLKIPSHKICEGITSAYWPARLQKIENGKFHTILEKYNSSNELWLDGGHNAEASRVLSISLAAMPPLDLHVIYGSLKNKDYKSFLLNMKDLALSLWGIKIQTQPNSLTEEKILKASKNMGYQHYESIETIGEGLERICNQYSSPRKAIRILICGSLYLAGDVLRDNLD